MTSSACNIAKGITLTPPVVGRIMMGRAVLRNGKRLPARSDHFSLTTLVQNKADRSWVAHPLHAKHASGAEKLRAIPVRIAYNNKDLSLNNKYSAFDPRTGRVLCVGNGERAKRATVDGIKDIDCPKAEACVYGAENRCKNMSRAYFQVEGQEDELGVFILRTTSYNSLNYLATRLGELEGLSGGRTAGLPMLLVMSDKTTTSSFGEEIHFADLVTRPGMTLIDAFKQAFAYQKTMADAGLSIEGMEKALVDGLANGAFSDEIEDINEWVSDDDLVSAASALQSPGSTSGLRGMDSLAEKLNLLQGQVADKQAIEDPAPPAEPVQEELIAA